MDDGVDPANSGSRGLKENSGFDVFHFRPKFGFVIIDGDHGYRGGCHRARLTAIPSAYTG